jgi:hypothetical protein
MDRSSLLKLMHKFNKFIIFINKHFYILSFSAWVFKSISLLKNNKLIYTFYNLIKILLFVGIVFSVAVIAYFTDLNTPFNNTFSMYYDLLEPYIEIIKQLYNKVIDYFNNIISLTQQSRVGLDKDSILNQLNIENEIKSGIKSGIKEALEEVVEDMENESKIKSDYLIKNFIIVSSVLFTVYFFIYLPSDATDINQFNSINQLLINLKISVIDLISGKPGNPGTPGIGGNNISPVINTISPPMTPAAVSPISPSISTITPNTPVASTSSLVNAANPQTLAVVTNNVSNISPISEYVEQSTQTISATAKVYQSTGTETYVNGITVSKMIETTNILAGTLGEEEADIIKTHVNVIKTITD